MLARELVERAQLVPLEAWVLQQLVGDDEASASAPSFTNVASAFLDGHIGTLNIASTSPPHTRVRHDGHCRPDCTRSEPAKETDEE